MTIPYEEPLTLKTLSPPVLPEPARDGEPGGDPCQACAHGDEDYLWTDEHWRLGLQERSNVPGTVLLESRPHLDSFSDLPSEMLGTLGPTMAKVERAVLDLGDVARVHVYRFGDGMAHLHVLLVPRPLGLLDLRWSHLLEWEEHLPTPTAERVHEAGAKIAAAMAAA